MEFLDFARAGVIAVIGFVVALLAARGTHRVALRYMDVQRAMIARRIVLFGLLALVVVSVMRVRRRFSSGTAGSIATGRPAPIPGPASSGAA